VNRFPRRVVCCGLALLAALALAGCARGCAQSAHVSEQPHLSNQPHLSKQPQQALRLGAVLGESSLDGYARADEARRFEFPEDYAAHPEFRSEWWYLTLNLQDAAGADFGIQFTLFRQALSPAEVSDNPWQTNQVYLGHLALTTVTANKHQEFQRLARGHPALAGTQADPFAVWLEDWRLAETSTGDWQLTAAAGEIRLALTLTQEKSLILQGDAGLSRKGPVQASYYFSIPRFSVTGRIDSEGEEHQVTGLGWFDREWSTSVLGPDQTGWDWFALQFFDGTEFTGFQLRRRDGARDEYDAALRVDTEGNTSGLGPQDFSFEAARYWRDEHGVRWPVEWWLTVQNQRWRVVAAIDDQRMDTALVYWEGLVYVYDSDNRQTGRGYMELTGYADER